jgi:hypothetical protein
VSRHGRIVAVDLPERVESYHPARASDNANGADGLGTREGPGIAPGPLFRSVILRSDHVAYLDRTEIVRDVTALYFAVAAKRTWK